MYLCRIIHQKSLQMSTATWKLILSVFIQIAEAIEAELATAKATAAAAATEAATAAAASKTTK
jgi:hypothetical protein